jgi:DUF4097 and DUF4098 domain-containing protein YvlB
MQRKRVVIIVLIALGLMVVCIAACLAVGVVTYGGLRAGRWAEAEETISSEVSVEPSAALRVHNPVGQVTVRTWDRSDRVEVEATKRAQSLLRPWADRQLNQTEVQVRPEGALVRVDVERPEDSGARFGRVDLMINVPEEVDVEVTNESGHVRIIGVTGDVRVHGETGTVRLEDVTVGECDVMKATGDIHFAGRLAERGADEGAREVLLRTETGNIDFFVPQESQFTLDAESETGSVASKFELQGLQSGQHQGEVGRWLKGGVNQEPGGRLVVLRTETGNVAVGPR